MEGMAESMRMVAGDRIRGILSRLTSNRFLGMITGAGVTAVIQSSSVTTVLVVGFVSSGLMNLSQALGVIIGANVGTTITAQLVAFKITSYALVGVAAGFAVTFVSKREVRKAEGQILMGLGLVFFGMSVMGDAVAPLRSSDTFIDLMTRLENPLLGILVAAAFTAMVQSSSATTGIVIALAQQGLINTNAGIALVLGANVGTSVTALLAAIGKPREALRTAVAHTMFNVLGVLIWVFAIGILADVVEGIGGGVARTIANAHTIFNVVNAFLFIGLTPWFARLVERLVPERPDEGVIAAKYLDDRMLEVPAIAIGNARRELFRMAERVRSMLDQVTTAAIEGTRWELLDIAELDDEVDGLHEHIVQYLGKVSTSRLSDSDTADVMNLLQAVNDLEAIGDIIETNIVSLGLSRVENSIVVSDQTKRVLYDFHDEVARALDLALRGLTHKDAAAAKGVTAMKAAINVMEQEAAAHQAERLMAPEPGRLAAYRFEMDLIFNLKRVYYFSKRIARVSIPLMEREDL
ncbi:MAG: Na/Pi cotransporter family protein [Actinomycetia bacterium]|nr:Na/Pi cotransporter family protein [Actinomycetes bacterium]MCP4957955.1 Na/Pi cotransporter family protein [Actinomycetes bacterium]